ncbi:MAG: hypothetical protein OXG92_08225 [Chloroflexi bacterium]|nr:hypothetical protein [Chloroflexota bacterium]MDE2650938.1 hypothetical protein [Chloroflexota bacterium]
MRTTLMFVVLFSLVLSLAPPPPLLPKLKFQRPGDRKYYNHQCATV